MTDVWALPGPQLSDDEREHLQHLIANWSLLADLAFSDLLLIAPIASSQDEPDSLVVLGQVRPNNRSTLLAEDFVGGVHPATRWPQAVMALSSGRLIEGATLGVHEGIEVPVCAVPVGFRGRTIAVVLQLQGPLRGPTSIYEQFYLGIFQRLCAMVTESTFPFEGEDVAGPAMPRVGDGLLVVDDEGRCEFATPNAVSALHRLGADSTPDGATLGELGITTDVVDRALGSGVPVLVELEAPGDVSVVVNAIPLSSVGRVAGGLVLLRDVTDLRELGRLVVSKDAALREVHHRVKNNLQTVSSLLRLQIRRSDPGEGRQALGEAERRIRAIALVHEILSKEAADQVPFDSIVASLVAMAEDSVLTTDPVEITVSGSLGAIPAEVATPLAVTLAELLMNAVEHGFISPTLHRPRGSVGHVAVRLTAHDGLATVEVHDNGGGLPVDFDLSQTTSLGLSIVRDLVQTQLSGTIVATRIETEEGGGTRVVVQVPTEVDRT